MTLSDLLHRYQQHQNTQQIIAAFNQAAPTHLHIKGLVGSSDAFVAAAVHQQSTTPQLFILPDREEAAYFLNNLENLVEGNRVFFFPNSYKKNEQEIDNTAVQQRAKVLNEIISKSQITNHKSQIIVSYSEAICEKVITKKNLEQNAIDITVGENLSIDFIVDFLTEYDFERVDFVVKAGQFSVRGGIVDVYSYSNEMPYRIEFDGNQIGSVRTFDVSTQLSSERLNQAVIIPNVQANLIQENSESFFNFISPDTKIWLKNFPLILDIIQKSQVEQEGQQLTESEDEIAKHIEKFTSVEIGTRAFFSTVQTFTYNVSPQPLFNKNFNLLSENLKQNTIQGIKNFIFADTTKQIERLYTIFENLSSTTLPRDGEKNKVLSFGEDSGEVFSPVSLSIHEGFIDHDLQIACYTDHQIFDRYHRFKLEQGYTKNESITLKELSALKPGDYVTHIDHGIGRFGGLEKISLPSPFGEGQGVRQQEAIRLIYKDNDVLYVSIHSLHRIAKYSSKEGDVPTLHKLGSNVWSNLKQKTKRKVKDIAKDLILLYAKRKAQQGFAFSPDTYLQTELEVSFIYEDTPDQIKSTRDVKKDMETAHPMDRLICGDVGFGKTEIAIRAAFKAVTDSKQVAVLVPTTILALQHFKTFKERLKDFPCTIDYINRFKSSKQQTETMKNLAEGKIDIIIGTHRLLNKEIKFKELGLFIVDEEQKFGVAAKEKLKALRVNVDTLTLTATPIPRTLQFSLMGARDLSIINTPPPNRYPVTTEIHLFNEKIIRDAVRFEVERGGQVFFIHNRVQDIHEIAALVKKLCPDVNVAVGHGQMDGNHLEDIMLGFIEGDYDVLVSTTIVESGLDIPNANTIIINQAQHFGLSDLHQMRGRVGRSNKKAFCYLLTPPFSVLTSEARQRLKAIEEYAHLGSGINIAMRDLDIRGAGNMLGAEQSGFIAEIGFDMYHKILDEAIAELKEEIAESSELGVRSSEFASINNQQSTINNQQSFFQLPTLNFVKDCQIDTDLELLIPDYYVENITERMNLYKELDDIEEENKLMEFEVKLNDRFGALPSQTKELFNIVRLRWVAKELGFEKIVLKNNKMLGYFVSNPNSNFYKSEIFQLILQFVQSRVVGIKLKEDKNKLALIFNHIKTIDNAMKVLTAIKKDVVKIAVRT